MKKYKIISLFVISLILLSNQVYAKYCYKFEECIIELSRDINPPTCQVSYSTQEWTNQNVVITIKCNKEIEQVSGFVLSEDYKVLTKEVSENENGILEIRDFSGNSTKVEYSVNNIDKEPPQIIGCQNGETYRCPLQLDYSDNIEIKEIYVDKYDEGLICSYRDVYMDSPIYYGIDRTDTTLTINVIGHPKDTRKYNYYLDDKLYTTTEQRTYIYTGLKKGTKYTIKVEAIDENGNKLDTYSMEAKTGYFSFVTSEKNNEKFSGIFHGLDANVASIRYAVWNYYDEINMIWYDAPISNQSATVMVEDFNEQYYESYVIHAYMYDESGNVLDVVGFSIDLNANYQENIPIIDKYRLNDRGNYQIKVSDLAGNKIEYYIKVE